MNNKKKILMISSTSKIGGGPKHIFILSELINKRFNIYYALPKLPEISSYSKGEYIKISERKINLKDIFKLILFVRNNSIDVIHAHGKGAGFLGRILKIFLRNSLVFTFHGIHMECYGNLYQKIYILYENIFGKLDDHKIFVSNGELEYAKKNNIYTGKNFTVINNAVENKDLRNLKKNSPSSNYPYGIIANKINIISVCRLVEQKNIFEIFEIAKILNEYNFLVIGGGNLLNEAKFFIQKQNIKNVNLLGEKKDVYNYLYFADLCLSTSLYEGLPLSLLEAMSVGLPIVATKVLGNKDVVLHGQTGFLYELNDVLLAAKFINTIVKDNSLNYKFTINSQLRQRDLFSTKKMSNSYFSLYKNI
tara:strand:- start:6436 stop:7524 length:1089 start_codon:yes stop_codon:yes gene_type:complete